MKIYEFLKDAVENSIDEREQKLRFKNREEVKEYLKQLEKDVECDLERLVTYYLEEIDEFIGENDLIVEEIENEKRYEDFKDFYKELFLIAKDFLYLSNEQYDKKVKAVKFYGFYTDDEIYNAIAEIREAIPDKRGILLTFKFENNHYKLLENGELEKIS